VTWTIVIGFLCTLITRNGLYISLSFDPTCIYAPRIAKGFVPKTRGYCNRSLHRKPHFGGGRVLVVMTVGLDRFDSVGQRSPRWLRCCNHAQQHNNPDVGGRCPYSSVVSSGCGSLRMSSQNLPSPTASIFRRFRTSPHHKISSRDAVNIVHLLVLRSSR